MSPRKIQFLIAFGCIFLATASKQENDNVTCIASPQQVEIGETATVTCHFPRDVSDMTFVSISVENFPDDEPGRKEGVELVTCQRTNTPKLTCKVLKDGYTTEGDIKTTLSVRITNISSQHSGRFLCQLMPHEKEGDIPKSYMCSLSVSVLGSDVDKETNSAQIIAPVVVVLLVVVVAAVVFFVCYRKRRPDRERGDYREMQNRSGGRREASVEETDNTRGPDRIQSVRGQDGLVAQRREQFGGQGGTASNDLASGRTDAGGGGETTCTDDETTNGRADEGNTERDDKHDDEAEEDAKEPLLPAKCPEGVGAMRDRYDKTNNGRDDKGNAQGDDKGNAQGDDKDDDEADGDEKNPSLRSVEPQTGSGDEKGEEEDSGPVRPDIRREVKCLEGRGALTHSESTRKIGLSALRKQHEIDDDEEEGGEENADRHATPTEGQGEEESVQTAVMEQSHKE